MDSDLSPCSKVEPTPEVMCRELDGEAVLLHLETGHYYGLDEVGLEIWNLITEKGDLGEVLESLLETYETTSEQAWRDLTDLIGQMRDQGLVRVVPGKGERTP